VRLGFLSVLTNRNFALVWFAGLVSQTGDWVLITALPFFIYERTGSTLAAGTILIAYVLPAVLLGSVAGVFADRWNRKHTMIGADLVRAVIMLGLLLVQSDSTVWIAYVVAFAESSVTQFFGPAKNALVPNLVEEDRLAAANSLNSVADNLPRLIGPPIGGVLFTVFGLSSVAVVDSASYLCSGAMIVLVVVSAAPVRETAGEAVALAGSAWRRLWSDWLEGMLVMKRERLIAALFVIAAVAVFADSNLSVLAVAFVRKSLHSGAPTFGSFLTARGIGGLVGGLIIGQLSTMLPIRRLFPLSLTVMGLLGVLMFNIRIIPLDLFLIALAGIPAVGWAVSEQTLLQLGTSDAYRGRVFGAFGMTSATVTLAAMLIGGALGDRIGVIPMLNVSAALWLVAGVLAYVLLRREAVEDVNEANEANAETAQAVAGEAP
jgi:predicted MFS family arabinose efflux permease